MQIKLHPACNYCFAFVIMLALSFCNSDHKKYYLKDQWHVHSSPYFPLKAKPKKIIEYYYPNIEDIASGDTSHFDMYVERLFDKEGNILYDKVYVNDASWVKLIYFYSDTGYTVSIMRPLQPGVDSSTYLRLEPAGNGQYRQIDFDGSAGADTMMYRFADEGNRVETETPLSSSGHQKTVAFYNGQQLTKKIRTTSSATWPDLTETQLFYYGKDQALDSIALGGDEKGAINIFIKNSNADPIKEIRFLGEDTTKIITYSYLYDQKGNWIKRLEKTDSRDKLRDWGKENALVIRKIEY